MNPLASNYCFMGILHNIFRNYEASLTNYINTNKHIYTMNKIYKLLRKKNTLWLNFTNFQEKKYYMNKMYTLYRLYIDAERIIHFK